MLPESNPTKYGFIYGLTDESGAIRYVGLTSVSLAYRLERHISAARRGVNLPVYHWVRKHSMRVGIVLLETAPIAELDSKERGWIASMRSIDVDLLNVSSGGQRGGGFTLSEAQRAKIAAANRRRSPEVRGKIGEANRRRKGKTVRVNHTIEGLRRMSEANRKPKSEAAKRAMRDAALKRASDPEARALLVDRLTKARGPISEDTRAKLRAAFKGAPKSQETRERMRLAWIIRKRDKA